jgi:DNA-binding transcriptional regulator YiaG
VSTSTDIAADGYDLVPEYKFSEFGTSAPVPSMTQPWPYAKKAGASLLLTGVAMLSGLDGTSAGHYGSIGSVVMVGRTARGEFTPIAPTREMLSHNVMSAESRSDREEITWIKERSGLTWDQLGRVFGVSRRAVHMWANGGRLNESNARRLRAFSATIRSVESETHGSTPDAVRGRLLEVGPDGLSIIDRLRRERSGGPSWGAPFGPERLVGAVRDPLRTQVGQLGT